MKTLLVTAALAASLLTPAAALAQALPPATIAVVDLEKVQSSCTACKSATAVLTSQANAVKARETALTTPLQAEQKAIQTALDALPQGQEPTAALKARINAFNAKRQAGAQEIANRTQQLQRNQAFIAQQIQTKLNPIYQQVMQRRGANVLVEIGSTLGTSASLDVTNDVLAALNAALPSVQTTAPPAPAQPQGR